MRRNKVLPRQESLVVPPVQNPFVHRLSLGIWDMIKIAIMSVTIAPIRLILAALCLVSAWPLAALAMAFRSPEEARKPMTGWRKAINGPLRFCARCMYFMMGFHWVTVKGKRASKVDAPILVAAPHSSYFDAALLFLDEEINSVVSAFENTAIPVCGTLIRFTQPVYVSREDPNSRINTIKEIQQRAQSGGQWPQITIFPEGTCTNRSCLITFKPGAFYPGVPVQPVCLRYPDKLDTFTWTWDGPRAYTSLWLTLCQFHNRLEIEYLPVYYPSEEEKNDAKLYARNLRAVMAECLKVPVTDHTYDDCRLMLRAAKLNMPMAAGLIEFHKLHKKLGLTYDQMHVHLQKFRGMKGSCRGSITIQELGSYLKLPQSDALGELFRLYDRDGSGTIDFREYVIGLSLVSGPANTEDTVKFAFKLFDSDNKGFIEQTQLTQILNNAFKMQEPDVKALFEDIDKDKDGKISFEEFKNYSEDKPEYAALFTAYHELHQNGHPPVCEDGSGDKAKVD